MKLGFLVPTQREILGDLMRSPFLTHEARNAIIQALHDRDTFEEELVKIRKAEGKS